MKNKYLEAVIALIDEIAVITILLYTILYLLHRSGYISLEWIIFISIIFAAIVGGITYRVARIQASEAKVGPESLIGVKGEVIEDLDPEGKVLVEGEIWTAISRSGEVIRRGEKIRVTSYKGLTLIVEKVPRER